MAILLGRLAELGRHHRVILRMISLPPPTSDELEREVQWSAEAVVASTGLAEHITLIALNGLVGAGLVKATVEYGMVYEVSVLGEVVLDMLENHRKQ